MNGQHGYLLGMKGETTTMIRIAGASMFLLIIAAYILSLSALF